MPFKVGDRVQIVEQQEWYQTVGLTGTVVVTGDLRIGVEHDVPFVGGHNLNRKLNNDLGLWYENPDVKLRLIPKIELSDDDIDYLFS